MLSTSTVNGLLSSGSFFLMNPSETERPRMRLIGKSWAAMSLIAVSLVSMLESCWVVGSWRSVMVQERTKRRNEV
jgi:hypothetical protein